MKFSALLGIMFGSGHFQFNNAYYYRATAENGVFLMTDDLLPITLNTIYSVYDGRDFRVQSVDPFFVKFLEEKGLIRWNGDIGKINLPPPFIQSLHPENRLVLIANLFSRMTNFESNNYIATTLPVYKKEWTFLENILKCLEMGGIIPAMIEYQFADYPEYDDKIAQLCDTLKIDYFRHGNLEDNSLVLSFGPLGIKKIPLYDVNFHSKMLQHIFEDILPLGYQNFSQIERAINTAEYYNSVYSKSIKRSPSIEFREALDDVGYLGTHKLEIMLDKAQTSDDVKFCLPFWRLQFKRTQEKDKNI
jgi:hypothetical protein